MPINSRAKGKRCELEVVDIYKAHGWPNAHRTSDGRAQATKGDIGKGPQGVHSEVKAVERLNIANAMDQAIRDSNPLDIPVVVHKTNRHPWLATLPLEDLLPLLAAREQR